MECPVSHFLLRNKSQLPESGRARGGGVWAGRNVLSILVAVAAAQALGDELAREC